ARHLDDAALRDDVQRVAVDLDRVENVLVVRARVSDVVRIERRCSANADDQDEDREREEREVVAAEAPPGEVPRAAATNRLRLGRSELRCRVEGEFAFSPLDHSPPSRRLEWGRRRAGAPTRYGVRLLVTDRREVELVVHV